MRSEGVRAVGLEGNRSNFLGRTTWGLLPSVGSVPAFSITLGSHTGLCGLVAAESIP